MLVKMHACTVSVYQALSKEPGYEAKCGGTGLRCWYKLVHTSELVFTDCAHIYIYAYLELVHQQPLT